MMVAAVLLISILASGCRHTMTIGRGKIEGDYSITILGETPRDLSVKERLPFPKEIVLRKGEFFNLSELGLRDNKPFTVAICESDGYKMKGMNTYDVQVHVKGIEKPLYGALAFFKIDQRASSRAVANYYNLESSEKFAEVSGGRTAFFYEYYDLNGIRYPTYVLWISDMPLR